MIYSFEQVVKKKDGFLRGPFGSALKKSLFVPKGKDTIKVYEQSVPLEQDETLGNYYISREYFVNSMFRFEVKPNDFLISCSGVNYGAIYQLSNNAEHGVINQALLRVRLNNDVIDDNYFLYLFKSLIMKKITSGTGDSTIPNFPSMDIVKKIEFDLPELIRQKKVGFILSSIDKKIVNNTKINAELESIAKTLYDYWFLQFEFPNEEGKPYKSSGGKMIFNNDLKREIPEGWKATEILDLVEWITNSQPPKSEFKYNLEEGYIRFIQNRDYDSNSYYTYVQYKKSMNKVGRLDILIDKYGDAGLVRYGIEGVFNVALAQIKPKDIRFREYIRSVMLSKSMYTYLHNSCMASTRASLSEENLKLVFITEPTLEIVEKYESMISLMRRTILKNYDENQELSKLRDFLLPLLMNGQVTFKS